MNDLISPKYLMKLTKDIHDAIWKEYKSYKEVRLYIDKWHTHEYYNWNDYSENFTISTKESGDIDLQTTLHGIDGTSLLKIAIDLGVDTPDFIPSIPTFRNAIKSDYSTAHATFEKAFKEIETHPDVAIGLANSALESIVKEILKDDRIGNKIKGSETSYDLTVKILKEFGFYPDSDMPTEIKTISSSFLAINRSIEKLRSEKTNMHGKTQDDYIVQDPIYGYFILNSVATVGLFLNSFFKSKFPKIETRNETIVDELPF